MYTKSFTRSATLLLQAGRHGGHRQCAWLSGTTTTTTTASSSIKPQDSNERVGVTQNLDPPHSLVPTKVLLRSLLIATVSSHRILLAPSLAILSFLAQPRGPFFSVEKNPILYTLLKRTVYNHFCAGENEREVTSTIRGIKDMGFKGVILTYAREVVLDHSTKKEDGVESHGGSTKDSVVAPKDEHIETSDDEAIVAWRAGVVETVGMLRESDVLAIKFTGAGAAVADALKAGRPLPKQMMLALEEVCEEAIRREAKIFIDAEQQFIQPGIDEVAMDLMRKYNRHGKAIVYNTYQAYLKCTPDVLYRHLKQAEEEGFTIGVKLVRGAYINSEPRHLINNTKQDTDEAYDRIVEELLSGRYHELGISAEAHMPTLELFLATHNRASSLKAYEAQRARSARGLPLTPVCYGQLLGMADEVSCTLLQLKSQEPEASRYVSPDVYKCLSWGTLGDCTSYLMRRAVENRDAVSRTKTEYLALRREVWRRMLRGFRTNQR